MLNFEYNIDIWPWNDPQGHFRLDRKYDISTRRGRYTYSMSHSHNSTTSNKGTLLLSGPCIKQKRQKTAKSLTRGTKKNGFYFRHLQKEFQNSVFRLLSYWHGESTKKISSKLNNRKKLQKFMKIWYSEKRVFIRETGSTHKYVLISTVMGNCISDQVAIKQKQFGINRYSHSWGIR